MKKKGKILLACLVVLAGIAAWCLVPRPAVGEDYRAGYVAAGEELRNVTGQVDLERWNRELTAHHTVVAWEDGLIVGFGDMDEGGYLDRLFVHKDFQGRGIATAICDALEVPPEKLFAFRI